MTGEGQDAIRLNNGRQAATQHPLSVGVLSIRSPLRESSNFLAGAVLCCGLVDKLKAKIKNSSH